MPVYSGIEGSQGWLDLSPTKKIDSYHSCSSVDISLVLCMLLVLLTNVNQCCTIVVFEISVFLAFLHNCMFFSVISFAFIVNVTKLVLFGLTFMVQIRLSALVADFQRKFCKSSYDQFVLLILNFILIFGESFNLLLIFCCPYQCSQFPGKTLFERTSYVSSRMYLYSYSCSWLSSFLPGLHYFYIILILFPYLLCRMPCVSW